MEVELRHLRAFVAVAASNSFTRAADRLFITQPALTRTIRQLESLVGAALIDRDTHPISLTPAGEEFLPYASRILSHLEIGVGMVRKHANISLGFAGASSGFSKMVDSSARYGVQNYPVS